MTRKPKKTVDPLIGKRFGQLVVWRRMPSRKTGAPNTRARVLVGCDCGNRVVIPRAYLLRKPNPKSNCGKCGKESIMDFSPERQVWTMMIQRCTNPDHRSYKDYGGLGVKVFEGWTGEGGFERFCNDIGLRPTPLHSLDRIDPFKNYEPTNVRWVTIDVQATNKRHHHQRERDDG